MQRLRQKKINEFISDLNEREQKYMLDKLKNEIQEKEIVKLNFTINNKTRVIA